MSNYKKYTKMGGLNPFWVEEDINRHNDEVIVNKMNKKEEIKLNYVGHKSFMDQLNRYEAAMAFLEKYENTEKYTLAKKIIGIE